MLGSWDKQTGRARRYLRAINQWENANLFTNSLPSSSSTISNLPLPSHIMFGSFILLTGIALFASAVAHPISSPPTTPTLFEVVVGSLEGNTTYTPPYIVSQVPTVQPNSHANAVPFRRAHSLGMWYHSSSLARTIP